MLSPDDHDEAMRHLVNNKPEDDFGGLTLNEMNRLTYDTYEPDSPLHINQAIPDQILDQLPFFRLTEELLKIIQRDGSIKLTQTGVLPKRVLEELYSHRLITEHWIEEGRQTLSRELYTPSLATLRFNTMLSGLVRKTKGKLVLTKKAEEILAQDDRNRLFRITLYTYTEKLPWSDLDGYPQLPVGNMGWGFTIFLLLREVTAVHNATYYASKYLKAFPELQESFFGLGYARPEEAFADCYTLRTFEHFLSWWGFVKTEDRKSIFERDQTAYTASPALRVLFAFEDQLETEPMEKTQPPQPDDSNAMRAPSAGELIQYLISRNKRFTNSAGMEITWHEQGIFTNSTLFTDDNGPFTMEILTLEEDADSFIDGFRIKALDDIDRLGYNNSWMRYLNGYAEIHITPMELEVTFSFRIYKSRTTITSLELHFYDEEYKHLTLPEEFAAYFSRNERMIQKAVENRYKF